jgi:acyl carrier protein
MNVLIKSEDRLSQTVAEVLGVTPDELSEESSPDTILSWDSLGHLNLVIALEEEFGIRLSAEDVLAMRSVHSIRRILHQSGAEV